MTLSQSRSFLESYTTSSQNWHSSMFYRVLDTPHKNLGKMLLVSTKIFDNFEYLHSLCSHIDLRIFQFE